MAVSAKNSFKNDGFNPKQLLFGFNPNLASIIKDELTAMEASSFDNFMFQNQMKRSGQPSSIMYAFLQMWYLIIGIKFLREKIVQRCKGRAVVSGIKCTTYAGMCHGGGAYYHIHQCQLIKV